MGVEITNYNKSDIHKMSKEELSTLVSKLTLQYNLKGDIIQILKYHGKLHDDPNCKLFDKIVYNAGHTQCWFYVKIKDTVAVFSLNMKEKTCWDFFELIDCDNLYPDIRSSSTFYYGSKEKTTIKIGNKIDDNIIPKEFQWLDDFLTEYVDFGNSRGIKYYGVKFYHPL